MHSIMQYFTRAQSAQFEAFQPSKVTQARKAGGRNNQREARIKRKSSWERIVKNKEPDDAIERGGTTIGTTANTHRCCLRSAAPMIGHRPNNDEH
eukprot:scaffold67999_cov30-Attheya_sp.AAC.1